MLISRIDRGILARWWFTVDRALLSLVLMLMALGVLASMAASPPVAERLGYDTFHFFNNQIAFMGGAVVVLFTCSFFNEKAARRFALGGFIIGILLMLAALKWGPEIKGAHRWIDVGPVRLQPSELVKPCFVLMAAWCLSEHVRRPDMPGHYIAWVLFGLFATTLMLEPDFGQTMLVSVVFGAMLLVSGTPWKIIFGLIGLLASAVMAAYYSLPHVASRIDRFINPDVGDTFQQDTAIRAFHNGGLYGTGPGGGLAKRILPDAHTDFIFAVIGEEFGLIACALLVALFAIVVMRLLMRAIREPDPFIALSLTGLACVFGIQASFNMMVNVNLLPAKGMTLPFISYGGSSLISMAITMGLALALARKRPVAVLPQGLMSRSSA